MGDSCNQEVKGQPDSLPFPGAESYNTMNTGDEGIYKEI